MGTAYIAPDRSKIVAVYVNMASSASKITTRFVNLPTNLQPLTNKVYITNSSYNLRKYGSTSSESYTSEREITIPARSVVTVVYELKDATSNASVQKKSLEIYPNPVLVGGNLCISLPQTTKESISLYIHAADGTPVFNENRKSVDNKEIFTLPLSLCKGVYLLTIQSQKQVFNTKLIIN
jgi:hypothetical protein